MDGWAEEFVVAPFDDLLTSVPPRGEVLELDRCQQLAFGVDGLFCTQAEAQYAGWPQGLTTDGTTIQFCLRVDEHTLEVAGTTWLDFTGCVFPCRAEVRRAPDGTTSVTGYIGDVDPVTGEPPRMAAGTMVLPVRHDDGRLPTAEFLVGRRQVSVRWTRAFKVSYPPARAA